MGDGTPGQDPRQIFLRQGYEVAQGHRDQGQGHQYGNRQFRNLFQRRSKEQKGTQGRGGLGRPGEKRGMIGSDQGVGIHGPVVHRHDGELIQDSQEHDEDPRLAVEAVARLERLKKPTPVQSVEECAEHQDPRGYGSGNEDLDGAFSLLGRPDLTHQNHRDQTDRFEADEKAQEAAALQQRHGGGPEEEGLGDRQLVVAVEDHGGQDEDQHRGKEAPGPRHGETGQSKGSTGEEERDEKQRQGRQLQCGTPSPEQRREECAGKEKRETADHTAPPAAARELKA